MKSHVHRISASCVQCVVQASDQRTNARLTNATVTINVVRSQPPRFQSTPYSFSVSERAPVDSSIYRVSAFDSDLEVKAQSSLKA